MAAPTITSEIMETTQGHQGNEMQKLAEYLRALQEERGKVEAFKRELPLCMQLIDAAMETAQRRVMEDQCSPTASLQTSVLEAQVSDSERSKGTPTVETFRWDKQPKEYKSGLGDGSPDSELHQTAVLGRPAWTREAQLWTHQSHCTDHEKASTSRGTKRHVDFGGSSEQARTSPLTSSRLHDLSSKHRHGGAFVPFVRDQRSQLSSPGAAVPDLRVSPAVCTSGRQSGQATGSSDVGGVDVNVQVGECHHGSSARMTVNQPGQTRTGASQTQRKARRCWSPELHRRFVNALQQLGGSQVATPKQIREVMKVDSLTNDEVKSHLQKYRLHNRRPSPSPSSPSPQAPQLVVLGWMRPDQFQAAVGAASQSSTGGVCDDDPPLVIAQKYMPPPSTDQPQMQPPVISTSQASLPGPSFVTAGSPNSSSESYLDEADDVQERKSTSSGQLEDKERQLQSAIESKGSSTSLVDIGSDTSTHNVRDCNTSHVKLHTLRKTKAAA